MTNRTLAAPSPLPRSTPARQGVDPTAVERLLDALDAGGIELHSLMVLRHGRVVAEGWWDPYQPAEPHLLYSLSKRFTSTAIGLAIDEGLLRVDDLVTSIFPEETPADISPRAARMQVRHLLSMASGHHDDTLDRLDRQHLVTSFLSLAPEEEPGTWFTYNNGATMMLSAIITKLTGGRLLDYLRPRLLEPLGIVTANWQGVGDLDLGFSGLHLATEAIAKFGQLYLQRGVWEGRQLVPGEWVDEASRVHVDNPREPNPDWRRGYGYQFWMSQEGYRGDGAFGQFCLVLPALDAVVAMTSATEDMQGILDAVWSELLPALRADNGSASGEESLTSRLGRLRLPVVEGQRDPEARLPWVRHSDAPPSPSLCSVAGIDEVPDGWRLQLVDAYATFEVRCGSGRWLTDEVEVRPGFRLAVAACGGWTGESVFDVEALAMVQTPHRMRLSCDCATGVTTASWHVAPLGPTSPSALALEVDRG